MLAPEQVEWIRTHHERPDGEGYPDGLTAEDIPEGAALLALADAFDVMTAGRPYSLPKTAEDALAECVELAGVQFAPRAVAGAGPAPPAWAVRAAPGRVARFAGGRRGRFAGGRRGRSAGGRRGRPPGGGTP